MARIEKEISDSWSMTSIDNMINFFLKLAHIPFKEEDHREGNKMKGIIKSRGEIGGIYLNIRVNRKCVCVSVSECVCMRFCAKLYF